MPLIVIVELLWLRLSAVEWASGSGLGDAMAGREKEGEESLELAGSVVAGIIENSGKSKLKVGVQVVVFGPIFILGLVVDALTIKRTYVQ